MSNERGTPALRTGGQREFPLGVVLSVTHSKLLCNIGEVYDILNFLTGDSLMTHQLPRVCRECTPYILACYPELATINQDGVTPETWREWLAATVEAYGPTRSLEPMADGVHEYRNPIAEAIEMVGEDRVITISPDDLP